MGFFYVQGRVKKLVAKATRAPHGEWGRRMFPSSIAQEARKEISSKLPAPRTVSEEDHSPV